MVLHKFVKSPLGVCMRYMTMMSRVLGVAVVHTLLLLTVAPT
jgi:hypothetical protein